LTHVLINFVLGAFGSLAIFLITTRLNGEEKFSAPFFIIAIGIVCAALSAIFGYLTTWIILGIYTALCALDIYRDRHLY